MKATEHCIGCLKGLAEKTVRLSGGDKDVLQHCHTMIEELCAKGLTPPDVSSILLKYIKHATGVYNPYAHAKAREFEEAQRALNEAARRFPKSPENLLKLSALGNSVDLFTELAYETGKEDIKFYVDTDKIVKIIHIKSEQVVLLGDNLGDFVFDMPLVEFLQESGKTVHYAVKEHPVQNDLSMVEVESFGLRQMYPNIISTRTDKVGMKKEDMTGTIKELWESDAVVIAKGMANYETLSEYRGERPVIHIMKIKCPPVSQSLKLEMGTLVAKLL